MHKEHRFGRKAWGPTLLFRIALVCLSFGVLAGAWEQESSALVAGQRVRFWFMEGGQQIHWNGEVLAFQGDSVRVRYLRGGQQLSLWVPRDRVVGLQGMGTLVYTCQPDSKIYITRTNRRVCCPPTATGYHTRSGGDVICCPAGTAGVYSGQHHVLCQQGGGTTTHTHTGNTHIETGSVCRPGHTLYRAKSGKGYCCPPGTAGYYQGYDGITCRYAGSAPTGNANPPRYNSGGVHSGPVRCPPGHQAYRHRSTQRIFCCPPGARGNTLTGQCLLSNQKPCPPVHDYGHTAATCTRFRGTSWKCWYQERPGGSSDKPCMRCACKY
ncbi:hypothetical protein L6R29_22415 [Myxococcota bacterium]|nr:hypothetical protein [Myxococcota bacterium]